MEFSKQEYDELRLKLKGLTDAEHSAINNLQLANKELAAEAARLTALVSLQAERIDALVDKNTRLEAVVRLVFETDSAVEMKKAARAALAELDEQSGTDVGNGY